MVKRPVDHIIAQLHHGDGLRVDLDGAENAGKYYREQQQHNHQNRRSRIDWIVQYNANGFMHLPVETQHAW